MKTLINNNQLRNLALGIASVVMLVVMQGCGKNPPSAKDVNTGMLKAHAWNLSSLSVDGVDKTSLYTGMTLAFAAGTYTATHGDPVWPASDTWTLSDDGKTITRGDGVTAAVTAITGDGLTLTLTWSKNTFAGGRTASVAGSHIFTFVK